MIVFSVNKLLMNQFNALTVEYCYALTVITIVLILYKCKAAQNAEVII